MAPRLIDRIRSKIERAKQNIDDFQLRALAFYGSKPYRIATEEHPEHGHRVHYVASIDAVPQTLADAAADAIGNLRKPLDYIATGIEYAACGAKPKRHIYFPIGRDAAQYEARRRRYIQCAGQAAIDAFDATEPYKGGRGHAIWQLHELNNPDKHELPLTTAAAYSSFDLVPIMLDTMRNPRLAGVTLEPLWINAAKRTCAVQPGHVLLTEPLDSEMHEERRFLFEVAFHEPGVIECEPALETLKHMADLVGGVVDAFAPLLPD